MRTPGASSGSGYADRPRRPADGDRPRTTSAPRPLRGDTGRADRMEALGGCLAARSRFGACPAAGRAVSRALRRAPRAGLANRRHRHAGAPRSLSAGGSGSATSWPAPTGSRTPCWSRPIVSPGSFRRPWSESRRISRYIPRWPAPSRAGCAPAGRASRRWRSAGPLSRCCAASPSPAFPWNPIASIWSDIPAMLQPAAVVGVFGLGLLTVALAAAPATIARGGRAGIAVAVGVPLLLAAVWGAGTLRIPRAASAGPCRGQARHRPAQYSSTRKSPGAVQVQPLFQASRDDRSGRGRPG